MMRFFFDYATEGQSLYDYRGQEFRTPQGAIEFADAIVQDMKHSLSDDWKGWRVDVRNAEGMKFFSLPVEFVGAIRA